MKQQMKRNLVISKMCRVLRLTKRMSGAAIVLTILLPLVVRQSQAVSLSVLYAFGRIPDTGYQPNSRLILAKDGNFYGTCADAGQQENGDADGTVFKLTPSGEVTMVLTFHGSDGRVPNGVTQGSDGNFYGTTAYDGPSGGGTVLSLFVFWCYWRSADGAFG